jgi:hypothetical protein
MIPHLQESAHDYVSLAQSPAECDMIRYLAFNILKNKTNDTLFNHHIRLNQINASWDFYHQIYETEYALPKETIEQIANLFSTLKFENEFSLTYDEKHLAPYHPLLNDFPPLVLNHKNFDMKQFECYKITNAQPFLKLNYQYLTNDKDLKYQINCLNHTHEKWKRLQKIAYVKRITQHDYFDSLNGHRGVFAKNHIQAGTLIDYYSGEYRQYPDAMPPMLCTWRVHQTQSWIKNFYHHRKINRFNGWTDAFILGNMMKLVNSCYYKHHIYYEHGNIGCYYVHLKSHNHYISLPIYVAIKDIHKDTELMTFYPVSEYKNNRIYGQNI